MTRRSLFTLLAVAATVIIFLRTADKVQRITNAAMVDGDLLGCATSVVARVPAPQTPTPDQVVAACNEIGNVGSSKFTAVAGQFPPPATAFAAVIVHHEPIRNVLVGFYPIGEGKACELDTARTVHIIGPRPASAADLAPGDQLFWLMPR